MPRVPVVVESSVNDAAASTRKSPGNVPIPPRFTVEDNGQELVIRERWFQGSLFFLLFFVIAWDCFLVGWYWMLIVPNGGLDGPPGPFKWIFFVFPIIHVAVGAGLTYLVLAGFLNTTVIHVAEGLLTVRHGPLPWKGNLDLSTDGIEQIYCQSKITRNRDDGRTSTTSRFEVHAVAHEQKVKLLGGLQEADHALFVEQRLERFLGIEDQPIPGEMSAT